LAQARERSLPSGGIRAAWRALAVLALFIAGYVALDRLSYLHPFQQFNITPWNPQPALAVALLMSLGWRWLPAVAIAAWLAERVVRGELMSIEGAALAAIALTAGYAASAAALGGRLAVGDRMDTRRDVLRLAGVAIAGSLLTGALYVAALVATGSGPIASPLAAIGGFWIGDAIGLLVTLPHLLMLRDPARRAELARLASRPETMLQAATIGAIVAAAFALGAPDPLRYLYLLFLPLVWVAARGGIAGVAIASVVAQIAVIVAVRWSGTQALPTFELQALLVALVFVGYYVGVTFDERRRATEDLQRTLGLAVAGEMGASIAHEHNQPLLAVVHYAKASRLVAQGGDSDRARLEETLDKLVAEAKRAADVVRRLRELFRVGVATRERTSISAPLARAAAAVASRAQAASVDVAVADGASFPPLPIDALQIEVTATNLIGNAIDAIAGAGRPGRVAVELERARDALIVSVRDDGPGIAADDCDRVFEPLVTSKASGMGMGLTIARAIVEAHGGRMWAEPGPGGVVRFSLPLAARDGG
jgi:signal transduction histidine kinase